MEIVLKYLNLGFTHVIPFGFDHVLFIICISLACKTSRSLIIQCSVFTVAHSISLGLTSASLINPEIAWVEPLIAISILFASLENLLGKGLHRLRIPLIFMFGLIHGMGFAGALRGAGLPEGHFITALLGFNAGVECGQILVIIAVWLPAIRWMQRKEWYASRILYPVSSLIACIAFYWTLKRLAHS